MSESTSHSSLLKEELANSKVQMHQKMRPIKDKATTSLIAGGGMGVIAAILLIFMYLLYEVFPLFSGASVDQYASYQLAADTEVLHFAIEEQGQISARVQRDAKLVFADLKTGADIKAFALGAEGVAVSAFAVDADESRIFAVGFENGEVAVAQHNYETRYDTGEKVMLPVVDYPLGQSLQGSADGQAVAKIAVRNAEEEATLAVLLADGQLNITLIEKAQDFLSEEWEFTQSQFSMPALNYSVRELLINPSQRHLFVLGEDSDLRIYDLRAAQRGEDALLSQTSLASGREIATLKFLLGGLSLLAADDEGLISQWFWQPADGNYQLLKVREFDTGVVGSQLLATEHRRKGFAVWGGANNLSLIHSTAEAIVFSEQQAVVKSTPAHMVFAPRANYLLVADSANRVNIFNVDNEFPEASFSALWQKVWYESYAEPEFVWQSSASNNDFEPKYSFAPLAFGTLKAAFYSMLLAAPLAIAGAIYTAFFMAPALRKKIKPLIELMEALPTVILGFLAGLWLAPFVERHLPAIFSLLILMPVAVLLAAYTWSRMPTTIRQKVPEGWQPALLIPVVVLLAWACVSASQGVELMFFNGDARQWLTNELGIPFDQRNALVVGVAMGFAVIPTIFSIAEDAIFSVPKHLSNGSLALGATPWQTLVRVIMPTASPGIFSALMIGMGRAVGETMIVLMATGNTPIMDANIFEGMRTLAANIAVEVPEAEVDSTHYHILFLAAFVLFMFTFVVNTLAELVRQSLRERYGSL
jgi:phosphate transport system permease protein